ncbi:MAG: hypothetical protein ACLQVN_24660 [Bryobacteraceae bacterium]
MRNAFRLAVLAAWPLLAAAPSPEDCVWSVAQALSNGDAAAFREAFDPAMPGLKAIERNAAALTAQTQVESRIQFDHISGEAAERLIELDWAMDITQRGGVPGLTHRSAKVRCRVVDRGSRWRIASFEPADLFAPPPDITALWDMFHSAANALDNGDAPRFLSFFDPVFAAKVHLEQTIRSDIAAGELQPSLELVANEGDDRSRKVDIDWAIDLGEWDAIEGVGETSIPGAVTTRKSDRVTFRVTRIGKKWRIESFEPPDFFQLAQQ